ncbi:hypothetical protein DSL92_06235 [Billgrantia gudaonensis]|uniref:Uncharacterized protein n=1 Tax=Billgrantia gudaonensis TaxID=376427 RepID=A0A3S0QFU0_9GAMM|nr:hypothetical protein DSL92_06235 [Halomonas gudaonensis]
MAVLIPHLEKWVCRDCRFIGSNDNIVVDDEEISFSCQPVAAVALGLTSKLPLNADGVLPQTLVTTELQRPILVACKISPGLDLMKTVMYVAGNRYQADDNNDFAIVKFTPDGVLDPSFKEGPLMQKIVPGWFASHRVA